MAVELAIRLQRQKFSMPFAHVKNAYPPLRYLQVIYCLDKANRIKPKAARKGWQMHQS